MSTDHEGVCPKCRSFFCDHTCKQEQGEPVAWMDIDEKGAASGLRYWSEPDNRHEVALYTTPQQRKPLTDADYVNACMSYRHDFGLMTQEQRDKLLFTAKEWARAYGMNEAAHGTKE